MNEDDVNMTPQVETVPNENIDEETSRMLGFPVITGRKSEAEAAEEVEEEIPSAPGSQQEAPVEEAQPQSQPQAQESQDDFWGSPDANGNYVLSAEKLNQVNEALLNFKRAIDEEAAKNGQIRSEYERQYNDARTSLIRDYSDRVASLNRIQTPQPQPQESPLQKAKAAMLEQMKVLCGDEKLAENFVNGNMALLESAIKEQGGAQLSELQPLFDRMREKAYFEDMDATVDRWTNSLDETASQFAVDRGQCARAVSDYSRAFVRSYEQSTGRRCPAEVLEANLAKDSGKLIGGLLKDNAMRRIEARRQREVQPPVQTAQPVASAVPQPQVPQASPRPSMPAPPPQSVPSTVAGQRMVSSGDSLRMQNDAGLMGEPSGPANPDEQKALLQKALFQQTGIRFKV